MLQDFNSQFTNNMMLYDVKAGFNVSSSKPSNISQLTNKILLYEVEAGLDVSCLKLDEVELFPHLLLLTDFVDLIAIVLKNILYSLS